MNAEPTGRRLHLWTALILLAVFAAGAAAGAGLTWALRPPPAPPPGPRPGAGRPGPDGLPPHLAALGLTPEQEKGVRAILEARRPELEKAIAEAFPRVRAVQEATEREVRALLTPEQAARLDEQRARRPQRVGPMGGPPPGRPGGPPPGGPPPDGPPPDGPPGERRPPEAPPPDGAPAGDPGAPPRPPPVR